MVKPALNFLSDPIYEGANEEFLKAHEYYRKRDYKGCMNNCLKAFESCLKSICDRRGWSYDAERSTAKDLIQIVFNNELIPTFMQSHFSALKSTLESGLPTTRNRKAGHGQGPKKIVVPEYIAAYALHLTASNILLLTKANKKIEGEKSSSDDKHDGVVAKGTIIPPSGAKGSESPSRESVRYITLPPSNRCHTDFHQSKDSDRTSNPQGKAYWDKFETYVKENGNQLQLFPKPDLPAIYGIQVDRKTLESADIHKDGAFWLVAYRSRNELQANLCVQSSIHYNRLKKHRSIINQHFGDNLGELKWEDGKKRIGFSNNIVGDVRTADIDQEFPWLYYRLLRLHGVFQPLIFKIIEIR